VPFLPLGLAALAWSLHDFDFSTSHSRTVAIFRPVTCDMPWSFALYGENSI
jgi:hypothetical protein